MTATAPNPFLQFRLVHCVPACGPGSFEASFAKRLRQVFITQQTHAIAGLYWAVEAAWQDRPISVHLTQRAAIDSGRELLNSVPSGGSIMIRRVDGRFREERTINHPDPYPPLG